MLTTGQLLRQFLIDTLLPLDLIGLLHQLSDILLKQRVQLLGTLVSDVFIFAGIGSYVSPVNGNGGYSSRLTAQALCEADTGLCLKGFALA